MNSKTTKETVQMVKELIGNAAKANADDALKFSQAACNSANALRALEGSEFLKAMLDSEAT